MHTPQGIPLHWVVMDAQQWNERYAAAELVWSATPNRFLVEQVEGLTPGRALDLAAGEGRNAVWLAQQGWTVTAVDFSPVGLDKGRRIAERAGVEIEWIEADVTRWDPKRSFDLVIVFYLQLPAAERRAAHRTAASAVKPGGTLLIFGHDRGNLERGVGGPPYPEVLLTAADVRDDLAGSSLAVEAAEQVTRPVETDDGLRHAIDCLVRARRAG
jgi:SAM-dependent methyltransferase